MARIDLAPNLHLYAVTDRSLLSGNGCIPVSYDFNNNKSLQTFAKCIEKQPEILLNLEKIIRLVHSCVIFPYLLFFFYLKTNDAIVFEIYNWNILALEIQQEFNWQNNLRVCQY